MHEDSDAQENAGSIVADSTGADTAGDEEEDSTAAEGQHEQAASGPSAHVPSPCPVRVVACGLVLSPFPAHGTHAVPAPFPFAAAGAHDHDPDPSHVAVAAADAKASPSPCVVRDDLSPSSRAPCLVHVGEAESLAVGSGIAAVLVHASVVPDLCLTVRVLCPYLAIRVPCPTTRALCRARVLYQAHVPCQTTRVCQTAPALVYQTIREPSLVPFAAAVRYAPSLVHEDASQEDLGGDGVAVGGVKQVVAVVDEPCAWSAWHQGLVALFPCRYQQMKAEDRAWYLCWVVGTFFRHDPHRA